MNNLYEEKPRIRLKHDEVVNQQDQQDQQEDTKYSSEKVTKAWKEHLRNNEIKNPHRGHLILFLSDYGFSNEEILKAMRANDIPVKPSEINDALKDRKELEKSRTTTEEQLLKFILSSVEKYLNKKQIKILARNIAYAKKNK